MANDRLARIRLRNAEPFIFIHIPKNGGLSIRKVLGDGIYESGIMGDIGTAMRYRDAVGAQEWERSFKFCFVRNPWERAVSIWRFIQFGHAESRRRDFGQDSGGIYGYGRDITFRQFLEGIPDANLWERFHMTSQSFHITDEQGNIMVDFIGRLERFQEDFDTVCDRIGVPRRQLPHVNRTAHTHYTEYYDDTTLRLVNELYAEDVRRLGYHFGE